MVDEDGLWQPLKAEQVADRSTFVQEANIQTDILLLLIPLYLSNLRTRVSISINFVHHCFWWPFSSSSSSPLSLRSFLFDIT